MKKSLIIFLCVLLPSLSLAAGGDYELSRAPINLDNKASLQRGAKLFVNYCLGCHSAEHQRYNRLARDLDLTDDLVEENLIFTSGTKVGDTMQNGMAIKDGKAWFGVAPPDLTLIARARGVDYLYTYLRTFYRDDSRPYGVNNAVFPGVGMPHVMWELQGWQDPIYEETTDANGNAKQKVVGVELAEPGSRTPKEFDNDMADLVNFLAYIGEPIQQERKRLGFWVLLYILFAFVVFYFLKKEYWKDVH